MDFTRPQDTLSINGFPVTFRQHAMRDGSVLWVPTGISRNDHAKCWRISVAHEEGVVERTIYDDRDSATNSLERAFALLCEALSDGVSRFSVDQRSRPQGEDRDPLTDTGVTGVFVARSGQRNRKHLIVSVHQSIEPSPGVIKNSNRYIGLISESDLADGLADPQEKLDKLLVKAVAVRRAYNQVRSEGIYPMKALSYEEVPAEIRARPVDLAPIDFHSIWNSYVVVPRPLPQKTTGGDAEALVTHLQSVDLTKPRKLCYLQDRLIRFPKTDVEGHTLYIPKQLYRSKDQWRIKLAHADGWFCDSIHDNECGGDLLASLQEAWLYLVSLFRTYDAPTERLKSVAEPRLSTGIPRAFIIPQRRQQRSTGIITWSFTLSLKQEIAPGEHTNTTAARWSLKDLDDDRISEGLRKAEAMENYRAHRLAQGLSLRDSLVGRETQIPDEFWPARPSCPVFADDLRHYVAERENAD